MWKDGDGKYGCIYMVRDILTNEKYIGQTVQKFEARKKQHLHDAFRMDENYFHSKIVERGIERFEWTILCWVPVNELNDKEEYYIEYYNTTIPNGFNVLPGAASEGNRGMYVLPSTIPLIEPVVKYWQEGLSVGDIIQEFGCCSKTVYRILNIFSGERYCTDRRPSLKTRLLKALKNCKIIKEQNELAQNVCALWEQGLCKRTIIEKYKNLSRNFVEDVLIQAYGQDAVSSRIIDIEIENSIISMLLSGNSIGRISLVLNIDGGIVSSIVQKHYGDNYDNIAYKDARIWIVAKPTNSNSENDVLLFSHALEAAEYINALDGAPIETTRKRICDICNHVQKSRKKPYSQKSTHGYNFMYYDEYNENPEKFLSMKEYDPLETAEPVYAISVKTHEKIWFESANAAARWLANSPYNERNVCAKTIRSGICGVLNGKHRQTYGFGFCKANQISSYDYATLPKKQFKNFKKQA